MCIYLVLLLLAVQTKGQDKTDFAVYADTGAWEAGVIAYEHFFDYKGLTHERIYSEDVNTSDLSAQYRGILFPGGWAYNYKLPITTTGLESIRKLVREGGAYIGMCAGAYFACDSIYWEEDGKLDYPLDLFSGIAIGALDRIAPWDDYAMTQVDMNPLHPINRFHPSFESVMYFGGPYFVPRPGTVMDTIATWNDYYDQPAVVGVSYGKGRVLLSGPHPEIEEDDVRDGTEFGTELADNGSDWPWLWSAVDWVLQDSISSPVVISVARPATPAERIELLPPYPNPFIGASSIRFRLSAEAFVRISVHDLLGRELAVLLESSRAPGLHTLILDGEKLTPGMYFCRLSSSGSHHYRLLKLSR